MRIVVVVKEEEEEEVVVVVVAELKYVRYRRRSTEFIG